jgi:ParB family transcriptional regulator, chromosome partitioning protein
VSKRREIEVSKLREPEHAARTAMDPDKLESLAGSIRVGGLIEPLIVTPLEDGTFEVVAGHRRLRAARMVGLHKVPCDVETDKDRLLFVKIHENAEREELSPVDEAFFLHEVYEQLGQDVERVASAVRKRREHVEQRLNMLTWDKDVVQAVRDDRLALGVASELMRMSHEGDRRYYLHWAMTNGCTVTQMKLWRAEANLRRELAETQPPDPLAPAPGAGGAPAPPPSMAHVFAGAQPWQLSSSKDARPCFCCNRVDEEWRMLRYYACPGCAERVLPEFTRASGS